MREPDAGSWLVGLLAGWWHVGLLVGWARCSAGWLAGWLAGCLAGEEEQAG